MPEHSTAGGRDVRVASVRSNSTGWAEPDSVRPTQGPASAPVLVSGSGFTADTQVTFGTEPAAAVRVVSANYLVATPPASASPGQVDITVRTLAGTSAPNAGDQYTIL